ncbi:Protein pih1d3 [Allomyces javanicus]|nr:Protein pih1d3 [Allomyces javanicus]
MDGELSSLTALFSSSAATNDGRDNGSIAGPKSGATARRPAGSVAASTTAARRGGGSKKPAYDYSTKSIWDENELANAAAADDYDPRPEPEYSIQYAQTVRTEDMYLGLASRANSDQHTDTMTVKIELPLVNDAKALDLTVRKDKIELRCPQYRLNLPLPNEVHEDRGRANWDPKARVLKVELKLVKLFDD